MKTCKKCNQDKPIDSFTVDTRYRDGRYPWCAECRRTWRQARKDKQRELHAAWREENRDHVRKEAREYYHEHKDQIAPKRRERDHQRWHNDPAYREHKRQQDKSRYQTNPGTRRRKIDSAIVTTHTRRARIHGSNTRYTQAEWRELCAKYNHQCLCCGEQKPLTPDHVMPISRGGTNDISNIQPLCLDCNLRKKTKTTDYRLEWGG